MELTPVTRKEQQENLLNSNKESGATNRSDISIKMNEDDLLLSCKLCLCDGFEKSEVKKILSCGCLFCVKCMQMYVETLLEDHQQIVSVSCPDSQCEKSGTLATLEIKELLVTEEKFSKYKRLKFEQEVAIDPSRTFCPKATCSAVCKVPVDENVIKTTSPLGPFAVNCSSCNHQFCYFCQSEWQPLHECPPSIFESGGMSGEFQKLRAKLGLLNGPDHRSATIKRCPFCGIPIERNRGCAQMICKNCQHVFCWYCLKLLDNDFMLRHYDKGPCRNMLGHSRAQVLRHRLGIIGLFVAFYLLVVISSPILLLAAPIILCCKFKECCKKRRELVEHRRRLTAAAEARQQLKQQQSVWRVQQQNLPTNNNNGDEQQQQQSDGLSPVAITIETLGSAQQQEDTVVNIESDAAAGDAAPTNTPSSAV